MRTKLERLLSKSLTTLEVMTYYLVVHTGPGATYVLLATWYDGTARLSTLTEFKSHLFVLCFIG